jgi:hypothetical protein
MGTVPISPATFSAPVASELQMPDAASRTNQENAMNTTIHFNRPAQRVLCMMLSTLIVAVSLSLAAYAAQHAADDGYSVTVTELQ